MAEKTLFKADGKQAIAVVAMIAAIFAFAAGEMLVGGILFVLAAVLSIGGLFWNAHRQDRIDAAAARPAPAPTNSNPQDKP